MGYAVAAAAARRHEVRLVTGPVVLRPPKGVRTISVVTAEEMCAAVDQNLKWCDVLIMAAAVCDWRPVEVKRHKIKKTKSLPSLKLERTPDILKTMMPKKGKRTFVGFAAETRTVAREARRKLKEKGLDLIVANDVSRRGSGFESDNNRVLLISSNGTLERLPLMPKTAVAARIVKWVEARRRT